MCHSFIWKPRLMMVRYIYVKGKRLPRKGNTMEKLLCPSMMCANFSNLEKEVKELVEAGVDSFI